MYSRSSWPVISSTTPFVAINPNANLNPFASDPALPNWPLIGLSIDTSSTSKIRSELGGTSLYPFSPYASLYQ